MKRQRNQIIIAGIVIIIFILALMLNYCLKPNGINSMANTTPTLFFHGFGSSSHAEQQMVNAAIKAGKTNTVIHANVNPFGGVILTGKIPARVKNPVVEVNYDNNRNPNYYEDGQWAMNVVKALQRKYGIRQMNMVGHSMGNMDIMYCLLEAHQLKNFPKLKKQVDIAGHFNGIIGYAKHSFASLMHNGKPQYMDRSYRQLLQLRQEYPNKQVRVLNIYGNIGNDSDGRVSNNSSRSLKYLLNNREISYEEKEIYGASHSELHENHKVDQLLINFLWK